MYFCANCGKELSIEGKVSRSDTCSFCHAYLRSCVNCVFYAPGYHNECKETQAELVSDKKASNFCEYFKFRERTPKKLKEKGAKDAFSKLFRE